MRDASELIAVIPKIANTAIHISFVNFNGHRFLDVRTFLLRANGVVLSKPRPTTKGIRVKPEKLPELIAGLELAAQHEGIKLPVKRAKRSASEASA